MQNYSIERLSDQNLGDFQTLHQQVFGKSVYRGALIAKYNTRFTGAQFIGYLARTEDGVPVAFYGVIPCYFRFNGEVLLAAQSADTMTHPNHQRRGLFMRLAKETYRLAGESGIQLIFGFPNQNSLPGFVNLGWQFLPSPMKLFRIPANPVPYFKFILRVRPALRMYSRLLEWLYPVEGGRKITFADHHDGVLKDDTFIEYKRYSDSQFIQVENVVVWIKPGSLLKVGYADLKGKEQIDQFVSKLKTIAFWSGSSHVTFITSENTRLCKTLVMHATPEDGFRIGYYSLTGQKWDLSGAQFEYCDIDIF